MPEPDHPGPAGNIRQRRPALYLAIAPDADARLIVHATGPQADWHATNSLITWAQRHFALPASDEDNLVLAEGTHATCGDALLAIRDRAITHVQQRLTGWTLTWQQHEYGHALWATRSQQPPAAPTAGHTRDGDGLLESTLAAEGFRFCPDELAVAFSEDPPRLTGWLDTAYQLAASQHAEEVLSEAALTLHSMIQDLFLDDAEGYIHMLAQVLDQRTRVGKRITALSRDFTTQTRKLAAEPAYSRLLAAASKSSTSDSTAAVLVPDAEPDLNSHGT